jgi:lysophospholipase L1-like esterase
MNQYNGALYRPIDNLHFNDAGYSRLGTFIANKVLAGYWQ